MAAHEAVAVDFVLGHDVVLGHVGAGLEGVAAPFGVVPVVALPADGSVAGVEGEGGPAAVFAGGVVGDAVGDVFLAVDGCGVREEEVGVFNGGYLDACGVLAGVQGVGVLVAWVDGGGIAAVCSVARGEQCEGEEGKECVSHGCGCSLFGIKKGVPRYTFYINRRVRLLLQCFAVTAHELVHTTSCVDQLCLTGVEWVRSVRDLKLDQRIGLTFEFDSLFCVAG